MFFEGSRVPRNMQHRLKACFFLRPSDSALREEDHLATRIDTMGGGHIACNARV